MQRPDDRFRTPNIKRDWGPGRGVCRGTRVVEEGQRSPRVDEQALDWIASVSSLGRALRRPTTAFEAARILCCCHRTVL